MSRFIGWKCIKGCCAVFLLMAALLGAASGEAHLLIEPDEWSWEENAICTFSGVITVNETVPDARLTLSVETRLEESGEAVFTEVAGKRLKIRKRSSETTADLDAGAECPFLAQWTVPADTDGGIAWASVKLTVSDSEGKEIATMSAEIGSRQQDAAAGIKMTDQVNILMVILTAASLLVWLGAILRDRLLRVKA